MVIVMAMVCDYLISWEDIRIEKTCGLACIDRLGYICTVPGIQGASLSQSYLAFHRID